VPVLLKALREAAPTWLWPAVHSGGSTPNWPFKRKLMSRFACLLARPLSPIRDAASGSS
jgi:dolichol-phosphate mannosyltransferase